METNEVIKLIICIVLISAFFTGCIESSESPESIQATPENNEPSQTRQLAQATPTIDPAQILSGFTVDIEKDVINILLIGSDRDSVKSDGNGRNDTTMVLQVNRLENTMKLIAFMRDMVFDVPNKGESSLNNSYYYGGIDSVKKLLDDEFDIKTDYYAVVSFREFESLMDIIGKVSIDQNKNVIPNISAEKQEESLDKSTDMNPYESLAYVRNRYDPIIDPATGYTLYSDEARNYRQRLFISTVWETLKTYPTFTVPVGVLGAITYVDTDMEQAMIITLITEMMESGATIETLGLPARKSDEKPYYSLYENLRTGEILAKSEIITIYENSIDKEEYPDFEQYKDEHYKISHIIGWNVRRTTDAIKNFLITD